MHGYCSFHKVVHCVNFVTYIFQNLEVLYLFQTLTKPLENWGVCLDTCRLGACKFLEPEVSSLKIQFLAYASRASIFLNGHIFCSTEFNTSQI